MSRSANTLVAVPASPEPDASNGRTATSGLAGCSGSAGWIVAGPVGTPPGRLPRNSHAATAARAMGRGPSSSAPSAPYTAQRAAVSGDLTGAPPEERIFGTAASVAAGVLAGAHIIRVHDVKEMREVVHVAASIREAPEC